MKIEKAGDGSVERITLEGTRYDWTYGAGGPVHMRSSSAVPDIDLAKGLVGNARAYTNRKDEKHFALGALETRLEVRELPMVIEGDELNLLMGAVELERDQKTAGYRGGLPEYDHFIADLRR